MHGLSGGRWPASGHLDAPPPTRQSSSSDEGLNDRRGKYVARLKGAKRQNNQLQLAFEEATTSEAQSQSPEGTEAPVAKCSAESLAPDEQWMERICQRENLWQALKRVKRNGGSPGVDGMTVDELPGYLKQHWLEIREQLLSGTYQPQPVRRVEIPKPDGGVRKTWRSYGVGSHDPAGGDAGSARQLG